MFLARELTIFVILLHGLCMKNLNVKWIYLLVLSIIWGSSFILIKKSLLGLTPYQLGALRTIITGFILLSVGYPKLKNIPKPKWKWLLISGLLGSFIPAFFPKGTDVGSDADFFYFPFLCIPTSQRRN